MKTLLAFVMFGATVFAGDYLPKNVTFDIEGANESGHGIVLDDDEALGVDLGEDLVNGYTYVNGKYWDKTTMTPHGKMGVGDSYEFFGDSTLWFWQHRNEIGTIIDYGWFAL